MLSHEQLTSIAWEKSDGLIPVIVQHNASAQVLMLGYMNFDALQATLASKEVTFFSRSKNRLWKKGESSGHVLRVQQMHLDCDNDTLLILADPAGPTCHTGTQTCFGEFPGPNIGFLGVLEAQLVQRQKHMPAGSYSAKLFSAGTRAIAQKVGEEGVETALAGVVQDDDALLGESADLIFHLMLLLRARGLNLEQVVQVLRQRHAK
jgi:phosphoribosyl-AMP cyclohydrolase / phosphoribosyl-ATP pyrophosphohydrolase